MTVFHRNIDKELEKLGFMKVSQDGNVVQYERKERWGVHCLDLMHKINGNHIIQSYQKGLDSEGFSRMCGLTCREAALAVKKIKQLGWR